MEDGSTLVVLAMDREGYANLCRLITLGRLRCEKGNSRVGWGEIGAHAEGAIALWGGDRSLLAGEADPTFVAGDLKDAFGDRLYALAARHRRAEEPRQEARLRRRAKRHELAESKAAEGKSKLTEYERLKDDVKRLEAESEEVAQRFEDWQPVDEKGELFAAEDRLVSWRRFTPKSDWDASLTG